MTMAEAALMACVDSSAPQREVPEAELNLMATLLAQLVTLFSVSDDRATIKPVKVADLQGATFSSGGRVATFHDGPPPLGELVMTRAAFKAALQIVKDVGAAGVKS